MAATPTFVYNCRSTRIACWVCTAGSVYLGLLCFVPTVYFIQGYLNKFEEGAPPWVAFNGGLWSLVIIPAIFYTFVPLVAAIAQYYAIHLAQKITSHDSEYVLIQLANRKYIWRLRLFSGLLFTMCILQLIPSLFAIMAVFIYDTNVLIAVLLCTLATVLPVHSVFGIQLGSKMLELSRHFTKHPVTHDLI